MFDINKTLHYGYNRTISDAYIISLKDNEISQKFTERCANSCKSVGRSYKIWEGFDGNSGKIIIPESHKDKTYLSWLKLYNIELSPTQIGCFLSHFSLWCHCIEIDTPIIILEHDAVMIAPFDVHNSYSTIIYLGSREQYFGKPIYAIPPHASAQNGHIRTICRAHAYSIDPAVAKNLVSYTIQHGIYESLDIYMRADLFPIIQMGLYAFDDPYFEDGEFKSTIHKEWNGVKSKN